MELHHQLKNRTEIKSHLILDTAMHIGTSEQVGHSDSPVVRNQFGEAFIPGASLKGTFRSRVESLIHVLGDHHWACFLQKNIDPTQPKQCLSTDHQGSTKIQELAGNDKTSAKELAQFLEENLCTACQLFGGASWRSKVLFDDLHLLESFHFPTELRDGVGIDRDSRKAVDGVKYDFEAVSAGSQFQFRVVAENLNKQDKTLFAMGMLELLHGHLALGGKTSRGLGSCHLSLDHLQIQFTDFKDNASVLNYFSADQQTIEKNPQQWLEDQLKPFLDSSQST